MVKSTLPFELKLSIGEARIRLFFKLKLHQLPFFESQALAAVSRSRVSDGG